MSATGNIENEGQAQLRATMRRLELKLHEVAYKTGTTKQAVHLWATGQALPNRNRRELLERLYGIDPSAWYAEPFVQPFDPEAPARVEKIVVALDVKLVRAIDLKRRSMLSMVVGSTLSRAEVIRRILAAGVASVTLDCERAAESAPGELGEREKGVRGGIELCGGDSTASAV